MLEEVPNSGNQKLKLGGRMSNNILKKDVLDLVGTEDLREMNVLHWFLKELPHDIILDLASEQLVNMFDDMQDEEVRYWYESNLSFISTTMAVADAFGITQEKLNKLKESA
jgi:hypothetical protein